MDNTSKSEARRTPWNKGKLIGQRPPLKQKEIWAIRTRLQLAHRTRDLALFNLAIDSKLRGCDLVRLRVGDIVQGSRVAARAMVMQQKTQRPVQFEITDQTREAATAWIAKAQLKSEQYLFPSRLKNSSHLATRQYAGGRWLGRFDRLGSGSLRHPFDAPHKSDLNLPSNQEPSRGPTPPRAYQT